MSNLIDKLKTSGFISIVISSTLAKIITFASAMFLPRFLSVDDYGTFVYTENILNYFLLINGIGLSNAILKYCSNNESNAKHKGYLITILKIGFFFDFFLTLMIMMFAQFGEMKFYDSKRLLLFMSFIPICTYLFECLQLYLRSNFKNKQYSILTFIYSATLLSMQILFAIFLNVYGVVIAKYISLMISVVLSIWFLNKTVLFKVKTKLPTYSEVKRMIKFSFTMLLSNISSLMISLNDSFLVGIILENKSTLAHYKVGSYSLQIMLFLTNAVITFILPYFVKHSRDKTWIRINFKRVFFLNLIVTFCIHIIMYVFSGLFIQIIFGDSYLDSIGIMRVFLIASFIQAAIRSIPGNILAVLGFEKYNLIMNVISIIIHAIVQWYALTYFGEDGIGFALVLAYCVSGVLMLSKMWTYIHKENKNSRTEWS